MMKRIFLFLSVAMVFFNITSISQATNEKKGEVIIYFTRHGKTMLNTTDRVQGWADSPLTDAGVEVAEQLGKGLKIDNIKFDAAYSSDSGRAIETANIVLKEINQTNIPLIQLKELREWNFGGFEGDLNANMDKAIADAANYNDPSTVKITFPLNKIADFIAQSDPSKEAENWEQASSRINKGFLKIAEEVSVKGGGNVLVVAHGLTINTVVKDIIPESKTLQIANAAVTKIIYSNGKFKVESINDTSYVKKGAAGK